MHLQQLCVDQCVVLCLDSGSLADFVVHGYVKILKWKNIKQIILYKNFWKEIFKEKSDTMMILSVQKLLRYQYNQPNFIPRLLNYNYYINIIPNKC